MPEKRRALVADSDTASRGVLGVLLSGWGWSVVTAGEAARAIEHLQQADLALVLAADPDVLRAAAHLLPGARRVALSADAASAAHAVAPRPFDAATLRPVVEGTGEPTGPAVLLVEDSASTRAILEWSLAKEGFRVRAAATLSEARTLLESEIPDAVIVDVNLPDGSGGELCRMARAAAGGRRVRVIVVSGVAAEAGSDADLFLSKPFSVKGLVAKVKDLLR
jgi:DNA-binding response OmpR family regulator